MDISKDYKLNNTCHEKTIVPIVGLWPNELVLTKFVLWQVVIFVWDPPPMPVGGIVVRVGMKPLWLATTRKRLWRVRAPRTRCQCCISLCIRYRNVYIDSEVGNLERDFFRLAWILYLMGWSSVCLSEWRVHDGHYHYFSTRLLFLQQNCALHDVAMFFIATFAKQGITLIPSSISNCIHYTVWYEIAYPFPNVNGCTAEIREYIM